VKKILWDIIMFEMLKLAQIRKKFPFVSVVEMLMSVLRTCHWTPLIIRRLEFWFWNSVSLRCVVIFSCHVRWSLAMGNCFPVFTGESCVYFEAHSHSLERHLLSTSCPSVCPHVPAWLPLDKFHWCLVRGTSVKIWPENSKFCCNRPKISDILHEELSTFLLLLAE
jgi:hypothetical protein